MRASRAFTIIELLISLSLASGIALALVTIYRSSFSYLETSREMMAINRSVCLLFNQLERDISAAFIPWILNEIEPKNLPADSKKQKLTPEEQQAADEKRTNSYFLASLYDNEPYKLNGKKVSLLKKFSCITTGPMEFCQDEKRARIVRVSYVLEVDKQKKHPGAIFYRLFRKESLDIDDVAMNDPQDFGKGASIRTFLVADGLKGLYVEWFVPDSKQTDPSKKADDVGSFPWGDITERRGKVPQYGIVTVEFWNAKKTGGVVFQTTIPILFHTTTLDQDLMPGAKVNAQTTMGNIATTSPQAPANQQVSVNQQAAGASQGVTNAQSGSVSQNTTASQVVTPPSGGGSLSLSSVAAGGS